MDAASGARHVAQETVRVVQRRIGPAKRSERPREHPVIPDASPKKLPYSSTGTPRDKGCTQDFARVGSSLVREAVRSLVKAIEEATSRPTVEFTDGEAPGVSHPAGRQGRHR